MNGIVRKVKLAVFRAKAKLKYGAKGYEDRKSKFLQDSIARIVNSGLDENHGNCLCEIDDIGKMFQDFLVKHSEASNRAKDAIENFDSSVDGSQLEKMMDEYFREDIRMGAALSMILHFYEKWVSEKATDKAIESFELFLSACKSHQEPEMK